ncbi:MAG TPA: glycosyltransferase family 4 protein [Thermoleophilaceae bacterium]
MRILVINQYYPPDASAVAYMLGNLVEDLDRAHDVQVIAGRPSYNPEASAYRPQAGRVTRVHSASFARTTLPGRLVNYMSFLLLALVAACRAERPDVIVVMTDPPVVGVIGMLASVRHRRPFVQLCHDVHPDIAEALGLLRSAAISALWRWLNQLVRDRAARIVVVGRDMAEKLAAAGCDPEKLVYVPTWAEDTTVPAQDAARERRERGWDESFVVMHAGNMGLAQNLDVLVDAAKHLQEHWPAARIVLLGDGAARPRIERSVQAQGLRNVEFLPHCPKEQAARLMAAADLHVVSLIPGLWGCAAPSKTYTIMALAKPFVASVDPDSEPARIAVELDCGRWVPAGDAQALATAVMDARELPLEELGARARRGFEQRYRRAHATAAIADLLEAIVRPSRPMTAC